MSEYNGNLRKQSESVFKIPTIPLRYRKPNYNSTQSTYNNGIDFHHTDSSSNNFKKVAEKFEVIKRICTSEEIEKILENVMNQFHSICYDKLAEQIRCNSQASSTIHSNSCVPLEPCNFSKSHITRQTEQKKINNRQRGRRFTEEEEEEEEENEIGLYIPSKKNNQNAVFSSKNKNKKKSKPRNELHVLSSDDESDSLSVFFKGRKKTSAKPSTKPSTSEIKKNDETILETNTDKKQLSVSINRVDAASESKIDSLTSRLRKRRTQTDEGPSSKKQSSNFNIMKTTNSHLNTQIKKSKTKQSDTIITRKSKRNNTDPSPKQRKSNTSTIERKTKSQKVLKNQTSEPKSQKVDKNPKVSIEFGQQNGNEKNSMYGFDQVDEGSFFGDVSSIIGANSLNVSLNSMLKNSVKHSVEHRNELPSHIFSPFANIRSTSGFSAISTPLSKSTAKNVLSKRIKKPNIVAEFKGERTRKSRKPVVKNNIGPIEKSSDIECEYEVECEFSDFSD